MDSQCAENDAILLELQGDDQLEVDDVARALNDTTLNTSSLYNVADSPNGFVDNATQLYFGPGFEDRLEIELDK